MFARVAARAALELDLAMHHHIAAVGDADRLVEILLRHQHGQAERALSSLDLVDDARHEDAARGPPTARRSSRMRGADISARAIASICCSPPLMLPASWLRRSCRRGKVSKQKSRLFAICGARGLPVGAEQQVLLDGEPREQPPPLRHQRDAEVDDILGGQADEVVLAPSTSATMLPRVGRTMPGDAFHQRALAVAVGAEQRRWSRRSPHVRARCRAARAPRHSRRADPRCVRLFAKIGPHHFGMRHHLGGRRRRRSCGRRPARRCARRSASRRA